MRRLPIRSDDQKWSGVGRAHRTDLHTLITPHKAGREMICINMGRWRFYSELTTLLTITADARIFDTQSGQTYLKTGAYLLLLANEKRLSNVAGISVPYDKQLMGEIFLRAVLPAAITHIQKCDKLFGVGSPWGSHETTGEQLGGPVACPIIVSAWLLVWRTPLSKLWETCTRRMRTLHGWLDGAINVYEGWTPNVFITKPIPLASGGTNKVRGRKEWPCYDTTGAFCAPPIDFVTTIPCWQWMTSTLVCLPYGYRSVQDACKASCTLNHWC